MLHGIGTLEIDALLAEQEQPAKKILLERRTFECLRLRAAACQRCGVAVKRRLARALSIQLVTQSLQDDQQVATHIGGDAIRPDAVDGADEDIEMPGQPRQIVHPGMHHGHLAQDRRFCRQQRRLRIQGGEACQGVEIASSGMLQPFQTGVILAEDRHVQVPREHTVADLPSRASTDPLVPQRQKAGSCVNDR